VSSFKFNSVRRTTSSYILRGLLVLIGLIFIVGLLKGLFYLLALTLSAGFEKEAEMREKFSNRLPAMQRLEKMQRVDRSLSIMNPEFYRIVPESQKGIGERNVGLSNDRWVEYRLLLEQAEIQSIRSKVREKPRALYFLVNELSGYAYLETPSEKKYHNLRACRDDGNLYTCYVYLRPSWYLYFFSDKKQKGAEAPFLI